MSGRQERRNRERGMGMSVCKRREAELRGRGGWKDGMQRVRDSECETGSLILNPTHDLNTLPLIVYKKEPHKLIPHSASLTITSLLANKT